MDGNFFDDLGMSSLLVAHFCARARERANSPPVSVKDVYLHPTIRSVAATVTELPSVLGGATSPPRACEVSRAGTAQYVTCGALQLLAFLASVILAAVVISSGFSWISASAGAAGIYLRSLAFSAGTFFLLCGLPILAKWTLVGRWKPREITVWSLPYLRFWLVKTLVQAVAGTVHWLAHLPAVPQGTRGQDRPPRHHLLQDRAGLPRCSPSATTR